MHKLLLLAITAMAISLLLTSCSHTTSPDVPFRAKALEYNRYAGVYHAVVFTSVVRVDSMYLPGDTIRLDDQQAYVLVERMK